MGSGGDGSALTRSRSRRCRRRCLLGGSIDENMLVIAAFFGVSMVVTTAMPYSNDISDLRDTGSGGRLIQILRSPEFAAPHPPQKHEQGQLSVRQRISELLDLLGMMGRRRTVAEDRSRRLFQAPPTKGFSKRRGTCMFHAGLGQNCDYRDMVGAVDEVNHWDSDLAPGKKRRR